MAATMVIDPRPDGWEIINADDFSNAGSSGRVASFIEKIEGISPQKTLDDAARTIGASDWVTVDDLDDDILESRKSALSPFDVGDDEYESYSSDKIFHTNTTHQSHVDGILDSVNGAIASTRKSDERRSPKDMYTLYDEDMDVDSQSNDFYGSISYGDPNDIGDFVLMTAYGPDGADGHMECAVRSNNEVINTFDANSWEDAKEQFRVQSEVDGMYDDDVFQHVTYPVDLGVDYLNPYSPRDFASKRSSMRKIKKTSAYEFGVYDDHPDEDDNGEFNGSICYGTLNPYEILDYIIMCAYGENGINGPMVCNVIDTGTGENVNRFEANSWEDAKAQFIQQSEVNKMYDNLLLSHKDSHKRASVRKADGDWAYWGESDNGTSKEYYYGEIDNENNSVMLYTEDQDPSDGLDCRVVAPDGDIITTFTAPTWEDAKAYFDGVRVDYDNFDGYVFTLYDWENRDTANRNKGASMNRKKAYNPEFSIWGEDIIENTANQFSASISYGEPHNPDNSVTLYADGDDGMEGRLHCSVVGPAWGDELNVFTALAWEDAKDKFDSQCNLEGMYDDYLTTEEEAFYRVNNIGASRKRASVENSNGHVFDDSDWDAIVQNMDPDIREQLSENLAPCSNQEFFDAYADAYYNKYGEEWELDKADPQW